MLVEDQQSTNLHWLLFVNNRFVWRYLTPLSTTFQLYQWRKPEDPQKTTDLSQTTDKLYHIMCTTSPWSRFKFTASVVMGTDCIGSCKSNYHAIMAMTALSPLIKPLLLQNIISLEAENLVVFYYLSASQMRFDKRSGHWWE